MICAIIQARLSSTRLPGKVLCEINGRPMLSYMLERVRAAQTIDQAIVATSIESSDDLIAEFCEHEGTSCYRGSLDDVLDRYYQAALQAKCDVVVRLTGDCPLIGPQVIDRGVSTYQSSRHDYVANTAPPEGATFPDGMDVEVFSFAALERAWREAKKPSEREHVTFYFWKNPQLFSTFRYDLPENLSKYRLTVDYPEDFEVISSVFTTLYPQNPQFTMEDVITFLEAHPNIMARNAHIASNLGWQPALEKDRQMGFDL
jgi:spore coat polysaccharide biosynthesis protein SpsF